MDNQVAEIPALYYQESEPDVAAYLEEIYQQSINKREEASTAI